MSNKNSNKNASPLAIKVIMQRDDAKDDVLTITPDLNTDSFHVKYLQHDVAAIPVVTKIDAEDITDYIESFLESLLLDEDDNAATHIQVDVPAFPSFVVPRYNIDPEEIANLMDVKIAAIYNSWPTFA